MDEPPIHPATASEHQTEAEVIAAWQAEIERATGIVGERALAVRLFSVFKHERGAEILQKAAKSKNPAKYAASAVRNRKVTKDRLEQRQAQRGYLEQRLGTQGAMDERAEYWRTFEAIGLNSLYPHGMTRAAADESDQERAAKRLAEFGTEDEGECLTLWLERTPAQKQAAGKPKPPPPPAPPVESKPQLRSSFKDEDEIRRLRLQEEMALGWLKGLDDGSYWSGAPPTELVGRDKAKAAGFDYEGYIRDKATDQLEEARARLRELLQEAPKGRKNRPEPTTRRVKP
jgi:hypothetical protein